MANEISKIKLPNNTTYDIKDVSARSAAATAQSTADGKISSSLKGVANGVAELDANGLVPTSQLPSYVDDVLEYTTKSVFPTTGESGKIYVDISTNLTYRWSGTAYVEISPSLTLGETSSTAYRGDRGKTAYTHATDSNRLTTATAVGLYKIGATAQGHVSGLTAVAKADITALGIPAQDTTYSSGTGITISGTTINHSNSVTAGTAKGDNTKTLSFGGTFTIPTVTYDAQGHITAKGTTTMTMPSNPNTDRYVNSAAFANDTSGVKMTLTRAGSDTATVTGTIPLVSSSTAGVAPKGATVSSQSQSTKFLREDGSWAAPSYTTNTNTTYAIGTSGNNITLTPSSGSVQSITAPYATSAGSATKATQDGSGNTITSTYVKKSGDTMTGTLTLYKEGTTSQNYPTELKFQNKDTTTSKTSSGYIRAYDGGESGANIVISPQGNMFIGSGEAAQNHYNLYTHSTAENFYATADGNMYLQANGQTIANRVGVIIDTSHNIMPSKADTVTNNIGSIGTSSYKWANGYFTNINGVAVGSSPKFTDTNTWRPVQNNLTSDSTTDSLSAAQGKALANGSARDSTKLPLAGGTVTGNVSAKFSTIDASSATNGVSSTQYPTTFNILDKSNRIMTRLEGVIESNGNIGAYWYVRNYNTSGTQTGQKGIKMTIANDGTLTYTVDDGAKFRSAIGAGTSSLALGTTSTTALKGDTKYAGASTAGGAATEAVTVSGTYSYNGGQQNPSYYGRNKVGFLMSNASVAGDTHFKNWIYMDNYGGDDAGGATAFGIDRNECRAFIMQSDKNRTSWNNTAALGVFTATPTSGQVIITDGTTGGIKSSGYTIAKSVPSDAKFTDTNTHRPIQVNGTEILGNNTTALNLKAGSNVSVTNSSGTVTIAATNTNDAVKQTKTTTNANYDILFSVSTSGTDTKTEGARKSDKIKFNPSQQTLTIGSGNDESVISNVDIKAKQYELRSPDKTLLVKMKLNNIGQTAILAEDSEGTMLWYNNYINSDGTLQWNNPITCSEAFSCASFLSGQIELKQASPYIDFHHNNSTADFTSRIITTNLAELTFYGKNSGGTTVYGTCRGAAFTVVSSKYVKENIKDITTDEAKKLLQLRPVSFDYKYTGETNKRGLIAEEVLEVMPEMVTVPEDYSEPVFDEIPDNVPSIDYSKFVPYLIKMVQIQQQEIDQLKEQIKLVFH